MNGGGDGGLAGKMENEGVFFDFGSEFGGVLDVSLDETLAGFGEGRRQPREVVLDVGAGEIVVESDGVAFLEIVGGDVGTDEAGATGD